ncbi:hypothetical protein [Desulfoscipio sp. XC116]|uniref:hypothetical protein n=1 Tax=Desulfoscipio sp. XC116 TaxID=3144975 RepID=UPI00325A74F6
MFTKRIFTIVFFLFVLLNCIIEYSIARETGSSQIQFFNNDNHKGIEQLIKQAIEYAWWSDDPNYREELNKFYAGPALEDVTESVKHYKDSSTDWYSLTFLENCHIVYNNGNTSIAIISIKDIDVTTNNIQNSRGMLILHKTDNGWRIKEMNYF